jgi:hypothetical protein
MVKRLRSGRSLFRREAVASRIHAVEKSFNHGWTQMDTDRKRNSAKQTSSPTSDAFPSLKRLFALVLIRTTILQLRARMTKIWTAVAACRGEAQRRLERSGDTAFRTAGCFPKRRGASLPAAVQNLWLRRKPRWVYPCPSVVKLNRCGSRLLSVTFSCNFYDQQNARDTDA